MVPQSGGCCGCVQRLRLALLLPGEGGFRADAQKLASCLAPVFIAAACWRRASFVSAPRVAPAQAFAPLRNRLSAGFFLVHGLAIGRSCVDGSAL